MVTIQLTDHQARCALLAVETLRNHYENYETFLEAATYQSFKECFDALKNQVPENTLD